MKPKIQIARRLALVSAFAFTASAHAANLTWDITTGDGATITAGGGNWDTSTVIWNNAGTAVAWSQTSATASQHAAIFAGADGLEGAYPISVTTGIAAQTLAFNNTGYALSAGAARTITLTSNTLSVASGKSATIGANVTASFNAGGSASNITGGGTLNISGTGATVTKPNNLLNVIGGTTANIGTSGLLTTSSQLLIGTNAGNGTIIVDGGTASSTSTTANHNLILANASGANTISGTLTINSGTVTHPAVSGGLRFGSTTVLTSPNTATGTLNLNGGQFTVARIFEGGADAGILSTVNFNSGKLIVRAGATNAANFMAGLNAANVLSGGAVIDTNGVNTTIAQALLDGGGGGGLTKEGNGILTLTGTNTYTGPTIINGGKLNLNAPYSSITATTVNANARLRVTTAATASLIPSITVNTDGGFEVNTGAYNASTLAALSTTTFNNNDNYVVELTGENIVPGDITVLTYGSKTGTGTPSLGSLPPGVTGTISDTGSAIVIDVDTAQVPSLVWSVSTGSWDTLTANWTGSTYTEGAVVTFPEIAGDNIVTLTDARSPFSVAISNNTTSTYLFNGAAISGSAAVTKTGTGAATFDVANAYTGVTTISSGGLLINADGALGSTAAGTTIASGASLGLANGTSYATAEPVSGSGAGIVTGFGDFAAGSRGFIQGTSLNSSFAGPVELNANGTSRIGVQDNSQLTLSGPITMADGVTTAAVLFRAGATDGDFITLSNSGNSWGGGTQIFSTNDGSTGIVGVRLGVDNGLPVTTTLSGGGVSTGNGTTLDLAGYNQTLDGLVNSNSRLHISNSSASLSTLTLNPSQDRSTVSDGSNPTTLIGDGAGGGTVALVKAGTFSQTLHGTNTYSGATTISGGSLALSTTATIDNTASMTITAGASFDVDAKASYAIPASMPVTLKLDGTAAGSAGKIVAQALDITAAAVTLDPLTALDDAVYILAEYTAASLTGTQFASVTGLPTGYTINYTYNSGTQIALVADVVPGFAAWIAKAEFGLAPGDQGPTDDPDNDGIENLLEFVLNGNPSTSDSSILPVLTVTATDFEFTYQRRDDSASPETTQTFEWGTTLATWPGSAVLPAASGPVGVATVTVSAGIPDDGVTDTVKVSIPKSAAGPGGKLFGRLQVTKP
jgi:autotransporter-associated beta strand protein